MENPTEKPVEITLVQTQENICGYHILKQRPGVQDAGFVIQKTARDMKNEAFEWEGDFERVVGIQQEADSSHSDFHGRLSFVVCVDRDDEETWISCKPAYHNHEEAEFFHNILAAGGANYFLNHGITSRRDLLSSALCVNSLIPPGQKKRISFIQVLDFPEIKFPGAPAARKKYTGYYGDDENIGKNIIKEAVQNKGEWKRAIEESRKNLPGCGNITGPFPGGKGFEARLTTQALNTLSFLAEATVWDSEDRFLIRECPDYPFFNSLDVYFYGSFGLLQLLPEIDGKIMEHFAGAIMAEDSTLRRHRQYVTHRHADLPSPKFSSHLAVRGAVIHDMGSLFKPKVDAYDWHNVKEWKDLAPKYLLMLYRHYLHTGNKSVLARCWESVRESITYLEKMIGPGESMPLTTGTDDTFDNLTTYGISVYCGSLWIAGLRAAEKTAQILGKNEYKIKYAEMHRAALEDFEAALWDEKEGYYLHYSTPITSKDLNEDNAKSLMAKTFRLGLTANPEDYTHILKELNAFIFNGDYSFLNSTHIPLIGDYLGKHSDFAGEFTYESVETLGLKEKRGIKKLFLYLLDTGLWNPHYKENVLFKDSDDIFTDLERNEIITE